MTYRKTFVMLQSPGMGLAPGGRMKQDIYADPHDFDAWDQRRGSRCFVTLVNSLQWLAITGERPPTRPPTARTYAETGLPWFDHYAGDAEALAGADRFEGVASVAQLAKQKGEAPLPENETTEIASVVVVGQDGTRLVRESWGAA